MADAPKDDSFLRKVARFVANPATDWADLTAIPEENRELELEKSELKAMIERKRRNDFVRRREFDMLRRVRREGLSPEQLAALGSSSKIDDTEGGRGTDTVPGHRSGNVKAKIDAIEKQMVGSGSRPTPLQPLSPKDEAQVSTSPAVMDRALNHVPQSVPPQPAEALGDDDELLPALPPLPPEDDAPPVVSAPPPRAAAPSPPPPVITKPRGIGLPPLSATPRHSVMMALNNESESVEVGEIVHDPELDPAVIAFANADFDDCERMLTSLAKPGGRRADHFETWLVLFDLFRATGQQAKFESLAGDYAQQFGQSPPQWYSLPKLVAEAAAAEKPKLARTKGDIGWVCPEDLDGEGVAKLNSITLQLPLPWVFDWSALCRMDAQAAVELIQLFKRWAPQQLEMRWIEGGRFFDVLNDLAPPQTRDADPAFWMLKLEALRLANRPDQFDEMAIEYCITYEVSPPSWEPAKALARFGGGGASTQSPALSQVTGRHSTVHSAHDTDAVETIEVANLDLSGQLVGDIAATLSRLNDEVGDASVVKVSCAKLIRVDFVAAGDLLNWVMTQRQEGRAITLTEAHRLVALFFGAMGINEHASVRVRLV